MGGDGIVVVGDVVDGCVVYCGGVGLVELV